jgi:hypothetical protein
MAVRLSAPRTSRTLLPRNITFCFKYSFLLELSEPTAVGRIRYIEKNLVTSYGLEPATIQLVASSSTLPRACSIQDVFELHWQEVQENGFVAVVLLWSEVAGLWCATSFKAARFISVYKVPCYEGEATRRTVRHLATFSALICSVPKNACLIL